MPANDTPDVPQEEERHFTYILDSPTSEILHDKRLTVSGWLVPHNEYTVRALRLRNNDKEHAIRYGLERRDVADALPELDRKNSLYSGFTYDLEFDNGELVLEVDLGEGFEEVKTLHLEYVGGQPVNVGYNPHMASNWAEHLDLLNSRQQYFYEEEAAAHFEFSDTDPKLVTFYLPQFYPIPENDRTWGKGFTEWRNVASASPRFIGHQQPILPADLGFYDLRVDDTIKQQIELAKQYGIYGFCFYYYWFSGKKLLETPLASFMKHSEWNFNFMICWANENWTKRWDGLDKDVIIAQQYLDSDALTFIKDVEDILLDPRYIRIGGKPALAVYRVADLNDPKNYVKTWREYFKKKHNLELHLISILSFDNEDPAKDGFDAAIEFVPQGVQFRARNFPGNTPPSLDVTHKLLDINYEGKVFDYRAIVRNPEFHKPYDFLPYGCVMPSWDKDARKKGKDSATFHNSSPDLYAHWLDIAMSKTRQPNQEFLFINAWNEWAEGTVMEPSLHYGHAHLLRTAEVLARHSATARNQKYFPAFGIRRSPKTDIAVVVHVYYPEQWGLIKEKLELLRDVAWDLFVTLTVSERDFEAAIKHDFPDAHVVIVPNRGRDILPFMHLARRLERAGYTRLLKLHTKKSLHRRDGNKWLKELVSSLLPSKNMVGKVLQRLSEEAAFIGPKGHYISLETYIGSNEAHMQALLNDIELADKPERLELQAYGYFGGSMFWVNLQAIKPLLDLFLMSEDFESERGQIDGTMAHAVERMLSVVAQLQGLPSYQMNRWRIEKVIPEKASRDYKYVT